MNYFKVSYDLNRKVTGTFPQSLQMADDYDHDSPLSYTKQNLKQRLNSNTQLAISLEKKAKLTDLISTVTLGDGLVISQRCRDLLNKFKIDPHCQILNVSVNNKQNQVDYFLLFSHYSRLEFLDFESMDIYETNLVGMEKKKIEVTSANQYKSLDIPLTRYVFPEKLIISNSSYDFFRIADSIALGYYASERLVEAIKHAGLTGFKFEPIEDLIFLR